MKKLNNVLFMEIKTYLVALIVSETEENKIEIENFLENLNKSLSLVEKVKKFKLFKRIYN